MHLNKIGLLALSCSTIFVASSCHNDTVSLKKATDWAKENFTHEKGTLPFEEAHIVADFSKTKGEDAKFNAIALVWLFSEKYLGEDMKLDENVKKNDSTFLADLTYCTYDDFVEQFNEEIVKNEHIKFSISKDVLTISGDNKIESQSSGKANQKIKYNNEGATLYTELIFQSVKSEKFAEDNVLTGSIKVTPIY